MAHEPGSPPPTGSPVSMRVFGDERPAVALTAAALAVRIGTTFAWAHAASPGGELDPTTRRALEEHSEGTPVERFRETDFEAPVLSDPPPRAALTYPPSRAPSVSGSPGSCAVPDSSSASRR